MKKQIPIILAVLVATTLHAAAQGSLTPPPGVPGPEMRSLQEIWDKLSRLETQVEQVSKKTYLESFAQGNLPWTHEFADITPHTAESISMAVAPNGSIVVAHGNWSTQDLRVSTENSAGWNTVVIPGTLPTYTGLCSVAIGPDGFPAISYRDNSAIPPRLSIARFNGVTWTSSLVDSGGEYGIARENRLAFGTDGHPIICYNPLLGLELRVARFNGTSWNIQTIASPSGPWFDMKIDTQGNPAVVYRNSGSDGSILISRWNGSAWIQGTVLATATPGSPVCLAFSPDGSPVVAFTWDGPRLASLVGNEWLISDAIQADSVVGRESLAFGPDGQPAVLHVDSSNKLWLTRYSGLSGKTMLVDENVNTSGFYDSRYTLKFTPDGRPVIAYDRNGTSRRLVVARM